MKNLKDKIEGILDLHFTNRNHYNFSGLLEAITSLIEQEKERAVMGFINYMYGQNLPLHKAGVVTVRAFAKQYLAERKG